MSETQGGNTHKPANLNSFYQSRARNQAVVPGSLTRRDFFQCRATWKEQRFAILAKKTPCVLEHPLCPHVSVAYQASKIPSQQQPAARPPSRLQLQGLGGLTHLAPIQGREQSTGPRSGLLCTICSQLLSPATPAPLVHNPLEPQDVILRKPAECWPGLTPDATALWFRSVLRQGLSHYATLAALPCNLRSPCWDWRCGP